EQEKENKQSDFVKDDRVQQPAPRKVSGFEGPEGRDTLAIGNGKIFRRRRPLPRPPDGGLGQFIPRNLLAKFLDRIRKLAKLTWHNWLAYAPFRLRWHRRLACAAGAQLGLMNAFSWKIKQPYS